MFLFILLFLVLLLVSPLIVGIVLLARKRVKAGRIILGIYGMLIVLFLVHVQFDKRSTSGHILRWFKGEGGIKQNVNDLAEDAKKSADPVELQHWAMTILASLNQPIQIPRFQEINHISRFQEIKFQQVFRTWRVLICYFQM
jgi:hypothetical protein